MYKMYEIQPIRLRVLFVFLYWYSSLCAICYEYVLCNFIEMIYLLLITKILVNIQWILTRININFTKWIMLYLLLFNCQHKLLFECKNPCYVYFLLLVHFAYYALTKSLWLIHYFFFLFRFTSDWVTNFGFVIFLRNLFIFSVGLHCMQWRVLWWFQYNVAIGIRITYFSK